MSCQKTTFSPRVASVTILVLCSVTCGLEAQSIDTIVESAQARHGIRPSDVCDDHAFLRRISLDLIGRIPTPEEQTAFLATPDRRRWIDRLLQEERFSRHWSEWLTAAFVGYVDAFGSDREVLRIWLQDQIAQDRPYDLMVRDLLTSDGSSAIDGDANFLVRNFDQASEKVCRLFLGVRLECARCHDHPFDRWTQDDFRRMRRFFEATEFREVSEGNIQLIDQPQEARAAEHSNRPRFLTGAEPRTTQWRAELALYVIRCKPFARAFSNRLWYYFFGQGIVDPPDDRHADNGPSIPELEDYLSQAARKHRFRLKPMIRLICNSKTYQRTSTPVNNDSHLARRLFAYQSLRPMTAEQLVDSTAVALGNALTPSERRRAIERLIGVDSREEDFSATWTYRETTQHLLRQLEWSFTAQRVRGLNRRQLFISILGREPSAQELAQLKDVDKLNLANALLHCNEFVFNH